MRTASRTLTWLAVCFAAGAYAQSGPSPIPADSPAAVENARNDAQSIGSTGHRQAPSPPPRSRRLDVTVGKTPAARTAPPSNDDVYNPRTKTETAWTQQQGTSATGTAPVPTTSGQPGTLQ